MVEPLCTLLGADCTVRGLAETACLELVAGFTVLAEPFPTTTGFDETALLL